MRTPIRLPPEPVARWMARTRYLRRADGLLGWLLLGLVLMAPPLALDAGPAALGGLVLLALLAAVPALRLRWRLVSGAVGLWMSRSIVAGARVWYVRPEAVELMIVTARRRSRVTIAASGRDTAEGLRVQRTRVLLLPADPAAPGPAL
jgi:hypothetical protein